jgi:RHS repeat-associated protein
MRARPGTFGTLRPLRNAGNAGAPAYVLDDVLWVAASWPGPADLYSLETMDSFDPSVYELTLPDGRSFVVDQTEGTKQIKDLSGNTLAVAADGIRYKNLAVPDSGKEILFKRDAQKRIYEITDGEGVPLRYTYDGADLRHFIDREGTDTSFSYSSRFPHYLEKINDPLGRTPITNEYDPVTGRLVKHIDAFGKEILYDHRVDERMEIVTDRLGHSRKLVYDDRGNVIEEELADGKKILRIFTALNNRTRETLPFDPAGPEAANPPKTVYSYQNEGRPTETDNVVQVVDPGGNATEYRYNTRNQVTHTRDARGNWKVNDYDPTKGWLLRTQVRKGAEDGQVLSKTEHEYWPNGQVKKQRVFADLAAGTVAETSYLTDGNGNVTSETDALGHATSYVYDGNGNRKTQKTTRTLYGCNGTACTASGTETPVTRYDYDNQGRLRKTTDQDGTFTETVYDKAGRQQESYDKLRRKTTYEYDRWDGEIRWDKVTYADGTYEESGYDWEGRRIRQRNRAGRVTRYEYDEMGRLRKTIHPPARDGEPAAVTESRYDSAGRLSESIDARLHSTFYGYDAAGRRKSVRQDVNGETIETVFSYDPNGNQEWVRDPKGQTTRFVYDEQNRRVQTDFPAAADGEAATQTRTEYDGLGRRTAEVDQAGKRTEFGYDALGRLTKVTQYLEGRPLVTEYGYDELSNRIWQKDANGHLTGFEYDELGREKARILPGGAREAKEYWPDGQLKTRTDFMGRRTTYDYDPETARLETRRAYDADGTEIATAAVSYEHTATGRRKTVTDSRGATVYGYDGRDRLMSLTYPDPVVRKLEYGHDANGNRTSLIATIGDQVLTMSSTYDDANRLDLVTDPLNRVYDHGYDKNGNRELLSYPNTVATAYGYDRLNRLRSLVTTRGVSPDAAHIQTYHLRLGPSGNRTQIVESQGLPQQRTLDFGYDDLYRLTSETVTELMGTTPTLAYQKGFVYDDVGNRQSQTTTLGPLAPGGMAAGTIDYGYDARDRLTSETLTPNPAASYGWDTNGNLTSKDAEATYTWDSENRLTKVTKADGTVVDHVYDADGNRVRTTTAKPGQPTEATDFLVDTSGGLSHVVAEIDATAGALKTYYVRGDDLLSVVRPDAAAPSGWQTRFYHSDYIGSVRRLTDENGNITDGYTYEAFGTQIAHSGTDPQPYTFTGEPLDPNSGWQYHRARWMDPRVGRFAAMDPFRGRSSQPVTLHSYSYAGDDGVNRRDPTGLFMESSMALLGGITIIAAMSVLNPQAALAAARPPIQFSTLWRSYPDENPCADVHNQCAMRVAQSLYESGVSFASYPGGKQPPCGIARAQELADWLTAGSRFNGQGKRVSMAGAEWEEKLRNKTGIVFFKDYWKRDTDKGAATTGDHIDLWNKDTLTRFGWASFFRFTLGIPEIPNPFGEGNYYSDLSESKAVWFWEVK